MRRRKQHTKKYKKKGGGPKIYPLPPEGPISPRFKKPGVVYGKGNLDLYESEDGKMRGTLEDVKAYESATFPPNRPMPVSREDPLVASNPLLTHLDVDSPNLLGLYQLNPTSNPPTPPHSRHDSSSISREAVGLEQNPLYLNKDGDTTTLSNETKRSGSHKSRRSRLKIKKPNNIDEQMLGYNVASLNQPVTRLARMRRAASYAANGTKRAANYAANGTRRAARYVGDVARRAREEFLDNSDEDYEISDEGSEDNHKYLSPAMRTAFRQKGIRPRNATRHN